MKQSIVFLMLAACGGYPPNALCVNVSTDAEVMACVTETLNKAAGCELVTVAGSTITTQSGTVADVSFVTSINEPLPSYDKGGTIVGFTKFDSAGRANVRIVVQPFAAFDESTTLMHELGHVFGLYFPDDKGDEAHSSNPSDIMFHESPGYLTTDNVKAYVAELDAQGKGCAQ